MDHCRIPLSHQVRVEQSLHLLRVKALLLHVLTKLLRMGPHHIHGAIMHLHVDIRMHDRCARGALVEMLMHHPLALRQATNGAPMLQSNVAKAKESLFSHGASICSGHLLCREPIELGLLLCSYAFHLSSADRREALHVLLHRRLLLAVVRD